MYRNFFPSSMRRHGKIGLKNAFRKKKICSREEEILSRLVIQKKKCFAFLALLLFATDGIPYFTKAPSKFLLQLTKFMSLKKANSHILTLKFLTFGRVEPNSSRWGTRAGAPSRRLHKYMSRIRRADVKSSHFERCWWGRRSPGTARLPLDPSQTPALPPRIGTSPSMTRVAKTSDPTRDDPSSKSAPVALKMREIFAKLLPIQFSCSAKNKWAIVKNKWEQVPSSTMITSSAFANDKNQC